MAISVINPDGSVNNAGQDESVKVSSNDTTASFLEDKVVAGSNVSLATLNDGANEQLEISAIASAGADTVAISANDTTPGNLLAKLVAGTNITLTENNDGGNETLTIDAAGGDAGDVTFTPTTLSDWTGSADPGDVDDALDQLAGRLTTAEGQLPQDASVVTFTPNDVNDWDSDTDPGDANDALDQLASRLSLVEAGTVAPDASQVTYTPAVLGNWNSLDPGNVDGALDFLADKVENQLSASIIGYTPAVLADWTGSTDPGDTNDALDQLADRMTTLEGASGTGSIKISADDTTFDFVETKFVAGTDISLTVNNPAGNETLTVAYTGNASTLAYTPSTLADWDSSLDPGNTNDALDQLADRLTDVEASTTDPDASVVTYTPSTLTDWNGNADPGNVDGALDQLAQRVDDLEINDTLVAVSADDTTPNYLENLLVAGTGITLTVNNPGGAETITIDATTGDASGVDYTPNTLSDWTGSADPGQVSDALDQLADRVTTAEGQLPQDASDVTYAPAVLSNWTASTDPGDTNDALDQLAARMNVVEGAGFPDAGDVTYTPSVLANWSGSVDPGDADDALDQLASRVNTLESGLDASNIGYIPSTLSDWNSSTDPGQTDDALDQLASRLTTLEAVVTDAGDVTYSPAVLTDWDGDVDPGDVDDALDQLAERVDDLEAGSGATPDASGVTYTPTDLTDWTGNTDPGNVDDALDQLADRVNTLEVSGGALTGFFAADTVIDQARTIPADHQTIFRGDVEIVTGGSITVETDGELVILPTVDYDNVSKIGYTPSVLTDWESDTDPGTAGDAIDQLADRVQTIEDSGLSQSVIYTKWDVDAPPETAGSEDDEFDDNSVTGWTVFDPDSTHVTETEDEVGLTIRRTSASVTNHVFSGLYKTIPGGDFTIWTKVRATSITENGTKAGLALWEDASNSTGDIDFYGVQGSVGGFIVQQNFTQYDAAVATQRMFHDYVVMNAYLRIRRVGTTYHFAFSQDGISWIEDPISVSLGYTPTHFGIICGNNQALSDWRTRWEFFRYSNSGADSTRFDALNGRALDIRDTV